MLEHRFRFHGHGGLRYVYRNGKTYRTRSLAIRFAANPQRQHSRAAVIVTRKVLKSAPKRNRIRRRVYEILRTHWSHLPVGYDLVFTVYDLEFVDMPAPQATKLITDALQEAHLWNAGH